jgi:hypothetical protein
MKLKNVASNSTKRSSSIDPVTFGTPGNVNVHEASTSISQDLEVMQVTPFLFVPFVPFGL